MQVPMLYKWTCGRIRSKPSLSIVPKIGAVGRPDSLDLPDVLGSRAGNPGQGEQML